jgi:hypothetical protein
VISKPKKKKARKDRRERERGCMSTFLITHKINASEEERDKGKKATSS